MIYFAQDEVTFFIKIGFTEGDAASRLKALQTGNPSPLVLLFEMPGSQQDETAVHKRLAGSRLRGEWFKPTREVLAFIAEHWRGCVDRPMRHLELEFVTGRYNLASPEAKFVLFLVQLLTEHGPLALSLQGPKGESIDHMAKGRAWDVHRFGGSASLDRVFNAVEDYAGNVLGFSEDATNAVGHCLDHRFNGVGDWSA